MDVFNDYYKYIKEYKETHTDTIVDFRKDTLHFVPCGFDIETSTQYTKDDKGRVTSHYSNMYIWQFSFGVDGLVFFGRTWEEFHDLLESIKAVYLKYTGEDKFLFFIHNVNFEQSFMFREMQARKHKIEVFARKSRHPMKTIIDDFFIILDSYLITGFSLEKLAKNYTNTQKLVGDIDYSLLRHHKSPIDDVLNYARNDVLILSEYAQIYYELYLSKKFMPMTSTMISARVVKDKIAEEKAQEEVTRLVAYTYPKNQQQYDYIMSYYTGAYTHGMLCNLFTTLEDMLAFDITSEYPFAMLSGYYPVSKWHLLSKQILNSEKLMNNMLKQYCVLIDVTFTNIHTKTGVTILSENKVICENAKWDNGRLYSADVCECRICEIDLDTLSQHYTWDSITYNHGLYAKRGKLPKYLRMAICELYAQKCILKERVLNGETDLKQELMQSKKSLNGLYGWIVCKVNTEELYYDENGWNTKEVENDFSKIRFRKQANPSWAIYITAISRNMILSVTKSLCDIDRKLYAYSDTDSIKAKNTPQVIDIFDKYNTETRKKNEEWIKELNLHDLYPSVDFAEMGTFTNETQNHKTGELEPMKRFKTLGSKRYLCEFANGEIESTVAGLSKSAFTDYIKETGLEPFEVFNEKGLEMSETYSKKLGMFYEDNPKTFEVTDYLGNTETVYTESYASLIPITFKMSVTDKLLQIYEYDCYLNGKNRMCKKGLYL